MGFNKASINNGYNFRVSPGFGFNKASTNNGDMKKGMEQPRRKGHGIRAYKPLLLLRVSTYARKERAPEKHISKNQVHKPSHNEAQ